MRFIIENPDYETIDRFIFALKVCKPLRAIGMENVRRDACWVSIGHPDSNAQLSEYKLVIAFDLPWKDEVIPVLTNLFEGSGFIISSLDNPRLRFGFA